MVEAFHRPYHEILLQIAEERAVASIWDPVREAHTYRLPDGTSVEPKFNIAPGTTTAFRLENQLSRQRALFGSLISEEKLA